MSSTALLEKVPEHWASMVRPFLLRSREFADKEPLVSYFLCTHVAFICMQHRKKEDKAGTAFLMTLLEALESDKAKLGTQLDGVNGRTTLTRFALMLFARADDAERTGNANLNIVRTFYTAAVLFEATAQFTDDGAMDSIAAQKCKYAKYIAARMKKALDAGEPYVSPNKTELVEGGPEAADIGSHSSFTTAPASCFTRPESNLASATGSNGSGGGGGAGRVNTAAAPTSTTQLPPPSMPKSNASAMRQDPSPPAYTYEMNSSINDNTPAPPPAQLQPPSNRNSAAAPQRYSTTNNNSSTAPSLPAVMVPAAQRQGAGNNGGGVNPYASPHVAGSPSAALPSVPSGGTGINFKPSVDQMIDAQKFASRAVSALQFYDYENARKQLIAALQTLNGVQH
jgi:vacuolar protein sorting-associated protein VTA1